MKQLFFIVTILLLTGCKQDNVNGIQIDDTLYTHQSYSENKEFCKLIKLTLDKDVSSLDSLIEWNCGGGAGCYDLGFVIVQIIYKMGESDFNKFCMNLDSNKKLRLVDLIMAGLEYGYESTRSFKVEFPLLYSNLYKK